MDIGKQMEINEFLAGGGWRDSTPSPKAEEGA
jgi:hypothetical protein